MVGYEIFVDGFAISSLLALGAIGFTIIFGVSGVLNLAHGGTMVVAAMIAWFVIGELHTSVFVGALAGLIAAVAFAFLTYYATVRPIQRSRAIPPEETEIFILTSTLLFGIMIQTALAYAFTTNPVTVPPFIKGVIPIFSVRTPINEVLIAVACWVVMGLLWLFVSGTRAGKALLAASVNPRALTLCGFELSRIHLLVWAIYGLLSGIAGVLLGTFLGASSDNIGPLTASAFAIVILGGMGSVPGSLIAAYVIGYLETITAYLINPTLRSIPALVIVILVLYIRPQGILGRR